MNNLNNIDDLFRKGTEQHYPVDEGLWAAVESKLPQHNINKSPWFYSLNSIVLLVVLITCSFIPKDNSRPNNIEKEDLNSSAATAKSTLVQLEEEQVPAHSKTSSQSQPNSSVASLTEIATKTEQVIAKQSKNNSIGITQSQVALNKVPKASSQPSNKILTKILAPGWKPSSPTSLPTSFDASIATKLKEQSKPNTLLPIPLLKEFVSIQTDPLVVNPKRSMALEKRPPSKPYYNVELEALLSVSISKAINNGKENILETKRNGESSIELRSFGLNVIGQKKHLIYGAGIQQSQYLERFAYRIDVEKNRTISSFDTNFRVINGNFNSNGTPVLLIQQQITENQSTEEYFEKDKVGGVNTIKWVGVPLFVGVQKSIGNWQANVRFSLITQYAYQKSGFNIADDLNSLNEISDNEISAVHFSNRNDLSIGYSVNEQIIIGARYALFQDINSFTNEYNSKLNGQLLGIWLTWKP